MCIHETMFWRCDECGASETFDFGPCCNAKPINRSYLSDIANGLYGQIAQSLLDSLEDYRISSEPFFMYCQECDKLFPVDAVCFRDETDHECCFVKDSATCPYCNELNEGISFRHAQSYYDIDRHIHSVAKHGCPSCGATGIRPDFTWGESHRREEGSRIDYFRYETHGMLPPRIIEINPVEDKYVCKTEAWFETKETEVPAESMRALEAKLDEIATRSWDRVYQLPDGAYVCDGGSWRLMYVDGNGKRYTHYGEVEEPENLYLLEEFLESAFGFGERNYEE